MTSVSVGAVCGALGAESGDWRLESRTLDQPPLPLPSILSLLTSVYVTISRHQAIFTHLVMNHPDIENVKNEMKTIWMKISVLYLQSTMVRLFH